MALGLLRGSGRISRASLRLPPEAFGMAMRLSYTLMAFLIGLVLARGLGPAAYGEYAFVLAWILLAAGLVQAGLPQLLVREVASYRQEAEHGLALGIIRTAQGFVVAVSLLFLAAFLLAERVEFLGDVDRMVLFLGLPLLVLLTLSAVLQASTRGLGRVLIGQMSEMTVRPGFHLLLLALLWLGPLPLGFTPASAMAAYTLAAVASLVFALRGLSRSTVPLGAPARRYDRSRWAAGFWKLSAIGWINAFNLHVSLIILGSLAAGVEVAQYRVAWQNAALIPIGLSVMNAIQGPSFSAAHTRGDRAALQRLASRNCLVSVGFALPVVVFLALWGEPFIIRVFGDDYAASVAPLIALAFGQLANAGVGPVALLLVASRNERLVLMTHGTTLVGNVLLCLVLVPSMGALGAALATSGAMAAGNLILLGLVRRKLGVWSLPLLRLPGGRDAP